MDTVVVKKWYFRWYMWVVYAFVFFIILTVSAADRKAGEIAQSETTDSPQPSPVSVEPIAANPQPAPTPNPPSEVANANAQKELEEFMALAKKAKVVSSYEFSNSAAVVYADSMWYQQTVTQKRDFLAHIALLKKAVTGYKHFEMRDAYSNEKVGEVTSFSGSIEVYK